MEPERLWICERDEFLSLEWKVDEVIDGESEDRDCDEGIREWCMYRERTAVLRLTKSETFSFNFWDTVYSCNKDKKSISTVWCTLQSANTRCFIICSFDRVKRLSAAPSNDLRAFKAPARLSVSRPTGCVLLLMHWLTSNCLSKPLSRPLGAASCCIDVVRSPMLMLVEPHLNLVQTTSWINSYCSYTVWTTRNSVGVNAVSFMSLMSECALYVMLK